jgi:multiple sugar transport system substrate-binding protein
MLKKDLSTIPSVVYTSEEFQSTFYPVAFQDLSTPSGINGIPLEIDGLALFYNEDIFNAAGKSPPKDWQEFRQTALDLTTKDDQERIQIAGTAMGVTENISFWPDILGVMLLQNHADPGKPTGTDKKEPNLAEDALTFFTLFSKVDRVWDTSLPDSTFMFATGKLAMYFGPSWSIFEINNIANQNQYQLNYKVIPIPQLPETNVTWASYWVEGVWNQSPHQQEAWEFLKFLSSKETMQQLYQNQSQQRDFGEPYSRQDLADEIKNHPQIGAYILQAPAAQSWYLASRTHDNGLNDQIIDYYQDAVNAVNNDNKKPEKALSGIQSGLTDTLNKYQTK